MLGRTNVDAFVSDHPHFHEMKARRRQLASPSGEKLWFITAEDLCVMKLLYGRTKDLADLERMFASLTLDVPYMREWLTKLPSGANKLHLLDDFVRRFAPV